MAPNEPTPNEPPEPAPEPTTPPKPPDEEDTPQGPETTEIPHGGIQVGVEVPDS